MSVNGLWIYHYTSDTISDLFYFPPSTKDCDYLRNKIYQQKKHNYGGFTMVTDPMRRVMAISLCSLKDQYCRKVGVANAIALLNMTDPMTNHVLVPYVQSRVMMALRSLAVMTAFNEHMKLGWPVDKFQVNVVLGVGKFIVE